YTTLFRFSKYALLEYPVISDIPDNNVSNQFFPVSWTLRPRINASFLENSMHILWESYRYQTGLLALKTQIFPEPLLFPLPRPESNSGCLPSNRKVLPHVPAHHLRR